MPQIYAAAMLWMHEVSEETAAQIHPPSLAKARLQWGPAKKKAGHQDANCPSAQEREEINEERQKHEENKIQNQMKMEKENKHKKDGVG